ncbi:MAG: hypothetical protein ACOC8F_06695 [Planctomycetota bacterium]
MSSNWKRFAIVAGVVFAAHAGLAAVRNTLAAPTTPYNEQYRMARYLLEGRGFVCPVGPPRDDPSSWYVPGYISLMAGVTALLGGPGAASLAAIRLLNLAALGASAGLYFLIARRLLGTTVAWVTAALVCLSPLLLYKSAEVWETNWAMLVGAAGLGLCVLAPPRRSAAVFAAGLGLGAGAMINPCWTLCYPVWVAFAWRRQRPRRHRMRDFARYAGLSATGFALAIAPWTVRNYRTFGELFYLRGNLPMELWVGNAPWSDGYFFNRQGKRIHPVFDENEARAMVRLGEWGYFRACRDDVARWWWNDPQRFVRLGLRRMRWFWFGRYDLDEPPARRAVRFAGTAVPGALALLGAVLVLWRRRRAWVLMATAAVFPLVYYASLLMVRYRLPVEPVLLTLVAVTLCEAGRVLRRVVRGNPGRA